MVTRQLRATLSPAALAAVALVLLAGAASAQPPTEGRPDLDVPFEIESMEIHRFDPPIRIGSGERQLSYDEALVFTLVAKVDDYDGLPPSVEPYLYIGDVELRTFRILREEEARTLRVVFHARDWERLEDRSDMVLTAEHVAAERKSRSAAESVRFDRGTVVDRRQ